MVDTAGTDQARTRTTLRGVVSITYALGCYVAFAAVFGYAVAFLANVAVPRTVDHGGPEAGTLTSVVVDSALLCVFALQHSVMARPAFKRMWTRWVPPHVERSTYVVAASAALALVFWQWRPMPAVVWDVTAPAARVVLWALFVAGWIWALAMSYAIDHLELFGLRQVGVQVRGLADKAPSFVLPLPYRLVRHPMMIGFFLAFLATPTMTVGHLLFAGLGSAYILVGVRFEERDLSDELPEYDAYAAVTPRFVPRIQPSRRGTAQPNGHALDT
jgi:methanethiol S-methyltransferase